MQIDKLCDHHCLPVLLICIEDKCEQRLLCLRCADEHKKHEMVSANCFIGEILTKTQVNRNNPDKKEIIMHLNNAKEEMLNRINIAKNKINGLLSKCQDKIQQYFSKLYFSLAADPLETVLYRLQSHLNNYTITDMLKEIKQTQSIILGNASQTSALVYTHQDVFRQKLNEISNATSTSLNNLVIFVDKMDLSKPEEFRPEFNRNKLHKSYLQLSDGAVSVRRHMGNGNFPLCLAQSPFSPINTKVSFRIDKTPNDKSVALGACIEPIVKQHNYFNCGGFNKGVYAIDQNNSYNYNLGESPMASWNHHDTHYNQSHQGSSTDLVGWKVKEGDTIEVQIDFYNSMLTFIKQDEDDQDDFLAYEMPVKLDLGTLYPFVSLGVKDSQVTILQTQPLLQIIQE